MIGKLKRILGVSFLLYTLTTPINGAWGDTASDVNEVEFEGCPDNAICSKQTGKKRQAWLNLLDKINDKKDSYRTRRLNKFIQKHGAPIQIWSFTRKIEDTALMIWDSSCLHHNKEGKKVYLGEIFSRNLQNLQKNKNLLLSSAYVQQSPKTIRKHPIPRGEIPSYLNGKSMVFIQEEEGNYYGLQLTPNGKISAITFSSPKHYPQKTKCPEQLVARYLKDKTNKTLFKEYACKKIWNKTLQKKQTVIYGRDCN